MAYETETSLLYNKTYLEIAGTIAKLSKAERKKVGAVIVKEGNILSFGFNGTPKGFPNPCEENSKTLVEVLHAESNAITKLAKSTQSSEGATLFVTCEPCIECSKLIIQAGIKEVHYSENYHSPGSTLLQKANIKVVKHD